MNKNQFASASQKRHEQELLVSAATTLHSLVSKVQGWDFAHLRFALSLKIAHFRE